MNKTIFIIAFTLTGLFGLGYYFISTNHEMKNLAEKMGLIEIPKKIIPQSYNAVFVIFDPSGSGRSTYSVPRITTGFINNLIDSIETKGSGDLWLSYISRSAYNTNVLHFAIPKMPVALQPPVRQAGERLGEFHLRQQKFSQDSLLHTTEIQKALKNFDNTKNRILKACDKMISQAYAPKKPGQDYSDIIGSLNAAVRVFSTVPHDSTHFRSILLISDGVQDVPKSDPHETLSPIPVDVLTIEINHSGSRNDLLAGKSVEFSSLERARIAIIRTYKPKNQ